MNIVAKTPRGSVVTKPQGIFHSILFKTKARLKIRAHRNIITVVSITAYFIDNISGLA